MNRYKDVVVGLGLDGYDDSVVAYAELVAFMSNAERVRFVHVLPSPVAFGDLYPAYRESFETARAEARDQIDAVAGRFEGPTNVAVEAVLPEGSPFVEILRIASDEAADLVVVGRDHDGGTTAEKLARKAPCSVLIVPPEGPAQIERVVVPVDFSEHAADAVDVAVAFAEAAELAEVHLLHIYPVSLGYLKLGKDRDEFARQIEAHARDRFERFTARIDPRGLRLETHTAEGDDVPEAIRRETAALGGDLVLFGTRGRTDTAAVLLGSVAEKLVRAADVPTVAVKRKGATRGLIDALFQL